MNWPLAFIGDCVEKIESWNPSTSGSEAPFCYIDLSSVDKDTKEVDPNSISEVLPSDAPSRARQLVKLGDVLVATVRPNLNGVALVPAAYDGATASTGYCILRPEANRLDRQYLYYWVQSKAFVTDMMKKATGANYPAVSDKIIKESKIPLPPLTEQKRIATILDKADAIRRKRQKAIQLADEFLRAVFLDMFGDPVTNPKGFKKVPLTDLADVITGFAFRSNEYVSDSPEAVRLCRGANTLTGYFDWSDTAFWPKNKLEKLDGYLIKAGDIILAMDRPWISSGLKVCVFPENQRKTYLVQRVARLRPHRGAYTDYIYSCIKSQAFEKHCCPTETTVPHISPIELKNFEILLPNAELIDKYHLVVSNINRNVARMVDGKCRSEDVFSALSQRAFAAQL